MRMSFPSCSTAILLLFMGIFCGCDRPDSLETVHALTPEEHFAAAHQCRNNPSDLPLAIWHYGQFLEKGEASDVLMPVARLELEECRVRYREDSEEAGQAAGEIRDLQEQLQSLRRRNHELESWLSRVNNENLALRQALLEIQGNKN